MVIYIVTFLICVIFDQLKGAKYTVLRKAFLFYLYIFFCFGYTTGTDWRFYEVLYQSGSDNFLLEKRLDQGFYYFIYIIRRVIPDFWLFLGLVKCLYLYSAIKVIKIFSNQIFTIIAILMNYQLLFMLIDNPLRFMCASIILLIATPFLLKKKYIKFLMIASLSIWFHFTMVVSILFAILVIFKEKPFLQSKKNLVIIYAIACVISLFPLMIIWFREYLATIFPIVSNKLLESYLIEGNTANFTIGSLIRLLFFCLLIYKKDIFDEIKNGHFIFYMAFIYFTLSRALMALPTGFRLSIYFSLFFGIALFYIFRNSHSQSKVIILAMIGVSMAKDLYSSYHFIPYTNSIYYIVSKDHQPYIYRDQLNKKAYKDRTGIFLEDKEYIIP